MEVFRSPAKRSRPHPPAATSPHETRLVLAMRTASSCSGSLRPACCSISISTSCSSTARPVPTSSLRPVTELRHPEAGARRVVARLRKALQTARKTRQAGPSGRACASARAADWQTVDIEVIPLVTQRGELDYPRAVPARRRHRRPPKRRKAAGPDKKALAKGRGSAKLEEELAARREYLQSIDSGARGGQRGAAVGERRDPVEQRRAAEHQRRARHREGRAAVDQRRAEHRQRRAARPRNEELTRVNSDLDQPARQRPDRHRHRRARPPRSGGSRRWRRRSFNLIPSDIGRPFSQISTTLVCPELPALITETIETASPVERTVQDNKGET